MSPEELNNTIEDFLELIYEGAGAVPENERKLRIFIDKIALAASETDVSFDDADYLGGTSHDQEKLRQLICRRFPNYGYYNIPSSITGEIAAAKMDVGDAIDDLLDITTELQAIAHLWDEKGDQKALRSFVAGYRFHFGDHLRELQLYLHALTHEESGF